VTWKHRFQSALKNKNWKKILTHQIFEYSVVGTVVISLESSPESWVIGIGLAFIVHMVLFEMVDAIHKKNVTHRYIPNWLHWLFESENEIPKP